MALLTAGCLLLSMAPAGAQSLAEVARKEQKRRETIKQPSKVYTNDDLRPYPRPAEGEAPAGETAAAEETGTETPAQPADESADAAAPAPAAPAEDVPAEPVRDEAYWRSRIEAARAQLERNELLQAALQSRINALTTDFVNRDDPAQRSLLAIDRQKALTELERVQSEVERLNQEILDIEEEARRAGVPPGWLR